MDAEKASVFIETPEANKIVCDDDAQSIQISDQHGNMITMDANGIEIKSAGDVKIDAGGNVEITGQKVDVKYRSSESRTRSRKNHERTQFQRHAR